MEPSYTKFFFPKSDYKKIALLFNIGLLKRVRKFTTYGYESSKVVLFTTKGKYVISAYRIKGTARPKSRKSIQYEIDLINTLQDLPTPKYLKTNKSWVIKFKDHYINVYKYLKGRMPKKINETKAYELGVFLGRFHIQGSKFKKRLIGRREFYNLNDIVLKKMDVYAKQQTNMLLIKNYGKVRKGVKENRLPKGLPRGPIHVDISPSNELFIHNKLSAVLDFGIFYRDAFLIDLGKTIMFNCTKNGRIQEDLFCAFMNGYESQRELSDGELRNLKKAILFAIYSHIYVDYYHIPLKIVPESYTINLVKRFLPAADKIEKGEFGIIIG